MFDTLKFYLRPLVCDNGGGLSMGRIIAWIVLYKCLTIVEAVKISTGELSVSDIPTNLFYTLVVLMIYNFSKKVDVFIKLLHAYNGNDVKLAEIEATKIKKDEVD